MKMSLVEDEFKMAGLSEGLYLLPGLGAHSARVVEFEVVSG